MFVIRCFYYFIIRTFFKYLKSVYKNIICSFSDKVPKIIYVDIHNDVVPQWTIWNTVSHDVFWKCHVNIRIAIIFIHWYGTKLQEIPFLIEIFLKIIQSNSQVLRGNKNRRGSDLASIVDEQWIHRSKSTTAASVCSSKFMCHLLSLIFLFNAVFFWMSISKTMPITKQASIYPNVPVNPRNSVFNCFGHIQSNVVPRKNSNYLYIWVVDLLVLTANHLQLRHNYGYFLKCLC